MTDELVAKWRERGALIQKDKEHFIIRMGFTGGMVGPGLMREVASMAEKYGGTLHLTTRQTVEIQNIAAEHVEALLDEMPQRGILHAAVGSRLRTVVACPGDPVCRFSSGDTQKLAAAIQERFSTYTKLNTKFKVALTGCRNSCAKPQENDLGIMADGKRGYVVFVGGKIGRNPGLGFALEQEYQDAEAVMGLMQKVFDWLAEHGQKKERLATVIHRLGKEAFLHAVCGA